MAAIIVTGYDFKPYPQWKSSRFYQPKGDLNIRSSMDNGYDDFNEHTAKADGRVHNAEENIKNRCGWQ